MIAMMPPAVKEDAKSLKTTIELRKKMHEALPTFEHISDLVLVITAILEAKLKSGAATTLVTRISRTVW